MHTHGTVILSGPDVELLLNMCPHRATNGMDRCNDVEKGSEVIIRIVFGP